MKRVEVGDAEWVRILAPEIETRSPELKLGAPGMEVLIRGRPLDHGNFG